MESIEQLYQKAHDAQDEGRLGKALGYIKRALALDTSNPITWQMLANLQFESGAFEASINSFASAVRLEERSPFAYTGMGRAYYELQRFDDAETSFRKAIRIEPNVPENHIQLGVVLSSLHRNDEAVEAYRRALRLRRALPEYPFEDAYYNLGIEYKLKENVELASRMFKKAIELDPMFAEAYRELGWVRFAQKKSDESQRLLDHALSLDGTDFWTHLYRAIVAWNRLDEKDAEESYRLACENAPHDPLPFTCLGEFYMETDRFEEAEACFREAISIDIDDADTAFHYGEFLVETNRHEEARKWLEKAIELEPRHVDARELLDRLDSKS